MTTMPDDLAPVGPEPSEPVETFTCSTCGRELPVAELAGYGGGRRFCEDCIRRGDELLLGRGCPTCV